eukprot:scpid42719/ scgid34507/ Sushi, von Willebrand factor type A, EGF and pentraxin domain-containing protein 1
MRQPCLSWIVQLTAYILARHLLLHVGSTAGQALTWAHCANTTYEYLYSGTVTKTFSAAATYCSTTYAGGQLATARNAVEDECVFKSKPPTTIWLAIHRVNGKWLDYETQTEVTYTNWEPGEPNWDHQNCVSMWYSPPLVAGDQWDNLGCDKSVKFVCQRKANVTCATSSNSSLVNGYTSHYSVLYPGNITYQCNPGYYISGQSNQSITSHTSLCLISGHWSTPEPTCVGITCMAPPPALANSSILSQELVYPGIVTYQCDVGYYVAGYAEQNVSNATVQCAPNGTWIGTPPTCLPGDACAGECSHSNTTECNRTAAVCQCRIGFTGNALVTCTDVNECIFSPCQPSTLSCVNSIGSYSCVDKCTVDASRDGCSGNGNQKAFSAGLGMQVYVGIGAGGLALILLIIIIVIAARHRKRKRTKEGIQGAGLSCTELIDEMGEKHHQRYSQVLAGSSSKKSKPGRLGKVKWTLSSNYQVGDVTLNNITKDKVTEAASCESREEGTSDKTVHDGNSGNNKPTVMSLPSGGGGDRYDTLSTPSARGEEAVGKSGHDGRYRGSKSIESVPSAGDTYVIAYGSMPGSRGSHISGEYDNRYGLSPRKERAAATAPDEDTYDNIMMSRFEAGDHQQPDSEGEMYARPDRLQTNPSECDSNLYDVLSRDSCTDHNSLVIANQAGQHEYDSLPAGSCLQQPGLPVPKPTPSVSRNSQAESAAHEVSDLNHGEKKFVQRPTVAVSPSVPASTIATYMCQVAGEVEGRGQYAYSEPERTQQSSDKQGDSGADKLTAPASPRAEHAVVSKLFNEVTKQGCVYSQPAQPDGINHTTDSLRQSDDYSYAT